MKFLIDANLLLLLCSIFVEHDVLHTLQLPDGNNTSDTTLNEISMNEQRILITKDTDFYHSYMAVHKPYKLVLVKLGNMRLQDTISYFKQNLETINELIIDHSFLILESTRIRVLD